MFADAGLGLYGADLFAEISFEGAAGLAAAADGQDRLALEVFQAEGQAAVEGGGGYGAAEDAGGDLEGRGGGEIVEAVHREAGGSERYYGAEEGFAEGGLALTRSRIAVRIRERRPWVAFVEAGGVVRSIRPFASHEKEMRAMTVAPSVSRARNERTAHRARGGKTNAACTMATLRVSEAGITSNCKPLNISDPAPKAKNASGSGLASGRSTMRVIASTLFCSSS